MLDGTRVLQQRASARVPGADANIAFLGWTVAFVGVIVPMLFVAYACGTTADSMSRVHILREGFQAVLGLLVAILAIGYAFVDPVQGRVMEENLVPHSPSSRKVFTGSS